MLLSSQLVTEKIFKGHRFRLQTATIGGLHLCPCFINAPEILARTKGQNQKRLQKYGFIFRKQSTE